MKSSLIILFFALFSFQAFADAPLVISSNPAATDFQTGSGALGEKLGLKPEWGIRLGGLWIGDYNYLMHGGVTPRKGSGNSLGQLCLTLDTEKLVDVKGGQFGAEFLQFNGRPTNEQAGAVQGYNGLPGAPPLDRSELYQLWYRQELFNKGLIVRIGKLAPTIDFANVVRPIPNQEKNLCVPATTDLFFTPVFKNPTVLGVFPGYYNSVYGGIVTVAPWCSSYLSYGFFDGNLARGKQTGLRGPHFNRYHLQIAELGFSWEMGDFKMPGNLGIDLWDQSGTLSIISRFKTPLGLPIIVKDHGIQGLNIFGSQRLWKFRPGVDYSGLIGIGQCGVNNSKTMLMKKYYLAGISCLGLMESRLKDTFGFGASWAKLNKNRFVRKKELMFQSYYQFHLLGDIYFLTGLSYIPRPGAAPDLKSAWAATARIIALF